MSRARFYDVSTDPAGRPLTGVTVTVYTTGTTTLLPATIYAAASGAATRANPFVTSTGVVDFWLEDPAVVDVKYTLAGYGTQTQTVEVVEATPPATAVTVTPVGGLSSTTAQAALAELDADLTAHGGATSAVHGIPDTTLLATDAEVATAVGAHDVAPAAHSGTTSAAIDAHEIDPAGHLGVYALQSSGLAPRVKNRRPVRTILATAAHVGHGWVAGGGSVGTQNLNDTTVASLPFGTQCITLTTNGAAGTNRVDKTGLVVDMTAKSIAVLLMVEDVTRLAAGAGPAGVAIYLGDNGLTNFTRWDIEAGNAAADANRYLRSGKWQWVTLQWGDTSGVTGGSGAPRAAITTIRVTANDDSTGAAVVHLAAVASQTEPTTLYPLGVCSFTFDDGYHSQWDVIRTYLDKYAYPSMLLPIVNLIGSSGAFLSLAELRQLRDFNQVDVGVHAYTDTNHNLVAGFVSLADGGLSEMQLAKAWTLANGLARGADFHAYPQGFHDDTVIAAAQQLFAGARTTNDRHKETWPPGDRFRIRTCSLSSAMTLAAAKLYIDAAVANKGWVAFMGHKFAGAADSITWVTSDFAALVDYAAAQGIAVRSPIDLIDVTG